MDKDGLLLFETRHGSRTILVLVTHYTSHTRQSVVRRINYNLSKYTYISHSVNFKRSILFHVSKVSTLEHLDISIGKYILFALSTLLFIIIK